MNSENLSSLWKQVLGELETEISKANFITLFKNTTLLSLDGNVATVATPSNMIIDLLKKKFYPSIKKALDKQTGENVQIVFIPKAVTQNSNHNLETPLFEQSRESHPQKSAITRVLSRVRPDFTFESMAVSSSNQLAFVSAQTVAKNLGHSYNPLFIYGPVGVGKTHLMQAIANEVFKNDPDKKIIYITSEEFTNEVVEAIRSNDTARMKKKFRTVSLLIIDDVQFIAGKDRVQEELFHTFNILVDANAQIVLSSDRPPQEIKKLEKRLSSRFSAGLTVDVESPDFELRAAILLIKAKRQGVNLSIECAKIIAQKSQDARSLEGLLLRIITEAKAKQIEITQEFLNEILEGRRIETDVRFHPDEIINSVCKFYNVKPTLLKGPKRDAQIVRARHVVMFLLKKELGLTFVEIGNLLGGRDHTTIMHGVEKLEVLMENKPTFSQEVMGITKLLSEENGEY